MPLYQYQALSVSGRKFKATIDADSLQDAKLKLIRRQVAVLQLTVLSEKQIRETLPLNGLLNLTREMARLLQAGLPLFETLSALEEKYRGQKSHRLLLNLCDRVRSGSTFSQSLGTHPEAFDLLYISMVANAEKTGRLSQALLDLGDLMARQLHLRKTMISALLYPALLSGFCFVVLASLIFYVIPSLKELFDGHNLHPFTQIVFAVSGWACSMKGFLLSFALMVMALIAALFLSPRIKEKIAPIVFRLPFLKGVLAKAALIRFCRASATLVAGGLPLTQAFGEAKRVMRHPLLEKVIEAAEERIAQGEPVHVPFQNHPLIPPLIPRMMGIADEGGKLPFMLQQIAEIYEEELERNLSHFTTVAQPLLLLVLGGIIGFVMLSVLLPLTDVGAFATG